MEIKPSTDTQEPMEGTNLEVDEAFVDTQEPTKGTLGEGIISLLEAYSDEEEPEEKYPHCPQEPVGSPSGEQVARIHKKRRRNIKVEAPVFPQEPVESTPQEHFPSLKNHRQRNQSTLPVHKRKMSQNQRLLLTHKNQQEAMGHSWGNNLPTHRNQTKKMEEALDDPQEKLLERTLLMHKNQENKNQK
jgi:hypothetical protein